MYTESQLIGISMAKKIFNLRNKRLAGIVLSILVIITAIYLVFSIQQRSRVNYAEEIARPFEKALVKSGGVRRGSSGDAGRGSDNQRPYYDAGYIIPGDKEQVRALVRKVAADEGFSLTQASSNNRGYLGAVADKYISSWYFDDTTKSSPYNDLKSGKIQLGFQVGDDERQIEPGYIYVRLNIQLPEFKK